MKPLLYADALNFAAHLAAVLLLYKLALQLAGRPVALFGAWFFLLDGRLNWTFSTGMETGLYTAGLVAFFWLWLREVPRGRFAWLAALGALVAVLRPEGHILISLGCLLTLAYLAVVLFPIPLRFSTAFWNLVPQLLTGGTVLVATFVHPDGCGEDQERCDAGLSEAVA